MSAVPVGSARRSHACRDMRIPRQDGMSRRVGLTEAVKGTYSITYRIGTGSALSIYTAKGRIDAPSYAQRSIPFRRRTTARLGVSPLSCISQPFLTAQTHHDQPRVVFPFENEGDHLGDLFNLA